MQRIDASGSWLQRAPVPASRVSRSPRALPAVAVNRAPRKPLVASTAFARNWWPRLWARVAAVSWAQRGHGGGGLGRAFTRAGFPLPLPPCPPASPPIPPNPLPPPLWGGRGAIQRPAPSHSGGAGGAGAGAPHALPDIAARGPAPRRRDPCLLGVPQLVRRFPAWVLGHARRAGHALPFLASAWLMARLRARVPAVRCGLSHPAAGTTAPAAPPSLLLMAAPAGAGSTPPMITLAPIARATTGSQGGRCPAGPRCMPDRPAARFAGAGWLLAARLAPLVSRLRRAAKGARRAARPSTAGLLARWPRRLRRRQMRRRWPTSRAGRLRWSWPRAARTWPLRWLWPTVRLRRAPRVRWTLADGRAVVRFGRTSARWGWASPRRLTPARAFLPRHLRPPRL
jgi:hypothetical protein